MAEWIVDATVFIVMMLLPQRKGIIAWRIFTVIAICWGCLFLFRWQSPSAAFLTLLFECFLFIPTIGFDTSVCVKCGKNAGLRVLFSNKCPYCGKDVTGL